MPISDEEAYKQGKRIAEAMQRGTYNPSGDYSDRAYGSGTSKKAVWIVLAVIAVIILIVVLSK